ncbi:MAG: penicillin-binding protein activator [Alphaproteobacteria bacterium]|nr:penicillin-binding protein activator [Alphaproteobacteria bacterium]
MAGSSSAAPLPRRHRGRMGLAAAALLLATAGCSQVPGFGPTDGPPVSAPVQPVDRGPPQAPSGTTIGTGPVRVALIVPLTQNGQPSVVGASLRNAADLAMQETGGSAITLLVKDSGASRAGARAAAEEAIREGAELILGPLFAGNVREVGAVARRAGKPVIAFSTDTSVSARGVYLLSFLVEDYVNRIVDFAADRGKKSFAALVPENDYGNVALAAFQQAAARRGVRVQAVERYGAGGLTRAAQNIGAAQSSIDTLFIPEQAGSMTEVSRALIAAGVRPDRIQIIGTGIWNDARVLKLPVLQGAWFSAPENAGFNAFAGRYRTKFNTDPTRIATLAYDAVTLGVALAGQPGARYNEGILTNSSGFNGADGLFRFRPDGQNERGLAVLQIGRGTTTAVSPAPRSFTTRPGT